MIGPFSYISSDLPLVRILIAVPLHHIVIHRVTRWVTKQLIGSISRPPACEVNALPLS